MDPWFLDDGLTRHEWAMWCGHLHRWCSGIIPDCKCEWGFRLAINFKHASRPASLEHSGWKIWQLERMLWPDLHNFHPRKQAGVTRELPSKVPSAERLVAVGEWEQGPALALAGWLECGVLLCFLGASKQCRSIISLSSVPGLLPIWRLTIQWVATLSCMRSCRPACLALI